MKRIVSKQLLNAVVFGVMIAVIFIHSGERPDSGIYKEEVTFHSYFEQVVGTDWSPLNGVCGEAGLYPDCAGLA